MRILIVRHRSLGDIVLTTPAVEAMRRGHPHAEIEYLAVEHLAPVLEHNPHVDRILAHPRNPRLLDDAGFTLRTARRRYDLVLDLYGNPRSAWLTWLTGAPVRVGLDCVRVRRRAYTRRVVLSKEDMRHNALVHLAAARAAGGVVRGEPRPRVYLTAEERASASEALGELAGRPFVAIHPGANGAPRRWPPERFAERAVWARDRFSLPSVILAGPGEAESGPLIAERSGSKLLTDRSPRELAARTAEAAVFCGNNSGPMHLAGALGVPVVAVFGPGLQERWRPLGSPSKVVAPARGEHAIADVHPDAVKDAFSALAGEIGLA